MHKVPVYFKGKDTVLAIYSQTVWGRNVYL